MSKDRIFLKEIWKIIINRELNSESIKNIIESSQKKPDAFFAPGGMALKRILNSGANIEDINLLLQMERYEACFNFLYMIDEMEMEREDLAGLYERILSFRPRDK